MGDTILIAPGVYNQANITLQDGVTLLGAGNHPEDTLLDGKGWGRIIYCEGLETGVLIKNLSFRNGWASGTLSYDQGGGAIFLSNSRARIESCRFLDNRADGQGGAIRCSRSSPEIIDCWFESNRAGNAGGALDCSYESSPVITDCYFISNTAELGGAVSCRGGSSPSITHGYFGENLAENGLAFGGAVFSDYQAKPSLKSCTLAGNVARYGGGVASFRGSPVKIEYGTLVGNTSLLAGAGILCQDTSPEISNTIIAFQNGNAFSGYGSSAPEVTGSDIFGNPGGNWDGVLASQSGLSGNISLDPQFCEQKSPVYQGFLLESGSPCAAPNGEDAQIGAWQVGCASAAAELESLVTAWYLGYPVIRWRLTPESPPVDLILTRSLKGDGAVETDVLSRTQQTQDFAFSDPDLNDFLETEFVYRLYQRYPSSERLLLGEVVLTLPEKIDEPPTAANLPPVTFLGIWPNPFNPQTSINFRLTRPQHLRIDVYSVQGKRIRTLADRDYAAGEVAIEWNGRDDQGRGAGSGTYFLKVLSEDYNRTHKVMLLK